MDRSFKFVERPQFHGLDVMKFLMSLCVVLIHVQSFCRPWMPNGAVHYVISLAVPFFFLASGYLLSYKMEKDEFGILVIKRYAARIWRMYFTWILIYVPLCAVSYVIAPTDDTLMKFIAVQVRSVFMFGEIRFSYPTWYLFSLAIAATALYFFHKRHWRFEWLMIPGAIGVIANYLAIKTCAGHTAAILSHSLFRVTAGMLYVTAGMCLKSYTDEFGKSWLPSFSALLLSVFLISMGMPMWELFGSFALFAIAMRYIGYGQSRPMYKLLRIQSIWIFVTHMYVLVAVFYLVGSLGNPYMLWGTVSMICVALSFGLTKWSQRPSGRFLNRLI